MDDLPPQLIAFLAAELLFLLIRSDDINIAIKRDSQRTEFERERIKGGLIRSLLLDLVLFVPASVGLFLLIFPSKFLQDRFGNDMSEFSSHAILGAISYVVPVATIRSILLRVFLKTLEDFQGITTNINREETEQKAGLNAINIKIEPPSHTPAQQQTIFYRFGNYFKKFKIR